MKVQAMVTYNKNKGSDNGYMHNKTWNKGSNKGGIQQK